MQKREPGAEEPGVLEVDSPLSALSMLFTPWLTWVLSIWGQEQGPLGRVWIENLTGCVLTASQCHL